MSHASHIAHANSLAYQLLVPQTKKKPEPKTARARGWFASGDVNEADRERIPDRRESDDESEENQSDAADSTRPPSYPTIRLWHVVSPGANCDGETPNPVAVGSGLNDADAVRQNCVGRVLASSLP